MASIHRIHVEFAPPPATGGQVMLEGNAAHYLAHVLRVKTGARVLVFGGAHGEWLAEVVDVAKKYVTLQLLAVQRPYAPPPDIRLCFAPVKNDKIDFLARRATELGVAVLQPIQTERTMVTRVNEERLRANLVEAAEQCGRVEVPELRPFISLETMLASWENSRLLIHADESGHAEPIHEVLPKLARGMPAAVLIGPEGGFSDRERSILKTLPYIKGVTLGPRILRAETAALTALAHLQAWLGDGDLIPSWG